MVALTVKTTKGKEMQDSIEQKLLIIYTFVFFRLESIQVGFIVVAVVMGLYSIILLVFGFLATGATRQNIYSGAKCIMGGRVSAGFVSFAKSFFVFSKRFVLRCSK